MSEDNVLTKFKVGPGLLWPTLGTYATVFDVLDPVVFEWRHRKKKKTLALRQTRDENAGNFPEEKKEKKRKFGKNHNFSGN